MQKYRSHKIVEAQDLKDKGVSLSFGAGGSLLVHIEGEGQIEIAANHVNAHTLEGMEDGYVVRYSDGYVSWSPRKAFEEGYAAIPPDAK